MACGVRRPFRGPGLLSVPLTQGHAGRMPRLTRATGALAAPVLLRTGFLDEGAINALEARCAKRALRIVRHRNGRPSPGARPGGPAPWSRDLLAGPRARMRPPMKAPRRCRLNHRRGGNSSGPAYAQLKRRGDAKAKRSGRAFLIITRRRARPRTALGHARPPDWMSPAACLQWGNVRATARALELSSSLPQRRTQCPLRRAWLRPRHDTALNCPRRHVVCRKCRGRKSLGLAA